MNSDHAVGLPAFLQQDERRNRPSAERRRQSRFLIHVNYGDGRLACWRISRLREPWLMNSQGVHQGAQTPAT